jgi:hypothetical protein
MFTNPVITDDRGEDHGDPFVLHHGGEYFLYHTTTATAGSPSTARATS